MHNTLSLERLRNTTDFYRESKKGFKIKNKNFGTIIKFDQPLLLVGHQDLNAKHLLENYRVNNNLTTIDQMNMENKYKNIELQNIIS